MSSEAAPVQLSGQALSADVARLEPPRSLQATSQVCPGAATYQQNPYIGIGPPMEVPDAGGPHTAMSRQVPATHACPPLHAAPQALQFSGSMLVFVHTPEQSTSGGTQTTTQAPDSQVSPTAHAFSHAPQLSLSESRSRQEPVQSVNPPGQEAAQVPAWQTSPVSHAEPQDPQLAGSR